MCCLRARPPSRARACAGRALAAADGESRWSSGAGGRSAAGSTSSGGAAVATLLTRGVVCLAGALILARRGLIRLGRPRLASLAAISRVGLPAALTGVLFSVVYVALTPITARFGTPALAALGVGHRVESWLYMIGVGFGAAAAAMVVVSCGVLAACCCCSAVPRTPAWVHRCLRLQRCLHRVAAERPQVTQLR